MPKKKVKVAKEPKNEVVGPKLTLLGEGSVRGQYRFAEFAGSITAPSEEEAFEKARELAIKHPDLLIK